MLILWTFHIVSLRCIFFQEIFFSVHSDVTDQYKILYETDKFFICISYYDNDFK